MATLTVGFIQKHLQISSLRLFKEVYTNDARDIVFSLCFGKNLTTADILLFKASIQDASLLKQLFLCRENYNYICLNDFHDETEYDWQILRISSRNYK